MTALAFDTHQAVKTLTAAGADEALAEAVVATVGDAVSGNVATKADLAEVKADLAEVKVELKGDIAAVKAEVAEVRAELKTDLAELKAGLYRHLWVMAAGIVGLTVSLTVALVRLTA